MRIGYARVSTDDQDTTPQFDALHAAHCERVYKESARGRSRHRPELDRMLDAVREGDVVVVQRLDRLGRSLKDPVELPDDFHQRGVPLCPFLKILIPPQRLVSLLFT